MATRKTTKRKTPGIKPIRKPATETYSAKAKRLAAEQAAAAKANTPETSKEQLLDQIAQAVVEFDTFMRDNRPKREPVMLQYAYRGAMHELREKVDGLKRQLEGLLNPEGVYDNELAEQAIDAVLATPGGEVPSWGRPGEFLLWLGYIPLRCVWGGFVDPAAMVYAADPCGLFVNQSGCMSASYLTRQINPEWPDVPAAFRAAVTQLSTGKDLKLQRLLPDAEKEVRDWLMSEAGAWAVEAIRRGPVNEVALPAKFAAVQQRMFA